MLLVYYLILSLNYLATKMQNTLSGIYLLEQCKFPKVTHKLQNIERKVKIRDSRQQKVSANKILFFLVL